MVQSKEEVTNKWERSTWENRRRKRESTEKGRERGSDQGRKEGGRKEGGRKEVDREGRRKNLKCTISLYAPPTSHHTHLSSCCSMCADAGDGSTVPLELHANPWLGAMTLPLVGYTLLTPHDKLVDIISWEGETGHSNWASLLVLKVKALLRGVCV